MNKLNLEEFFIIEENLKQNIIGCRINNFTLINSRDYILSLSMIKEEKLLISLNHANPFVCLVKTNNVPSTIIGQINDNLRKFIKDAFIVNVELFNKDRVFKFDLQKANELYEKERFNLYIECIPQRPNLIITNENNIVLFAAHYTSLTSSRAVVKNLEYVPLSVALTKTSDDVSSLEEIKTNCLEYYSNCFETRNKEKYEELFKFIKIRIKSLTKKLSTLENATLEAKSKLNYSEIGNMLLAYSYEKEELDNYVKENNLDYDSKLTPGQNAENYFKKYKKAKRTIEMNHLELVKAKEEIAHLEFALSSSNYMSDDELIALAKNLVPKKYSHIKMKKEPSFIGSVTIENSKISFGKNAKANNELTFKIANKFDTYVHIKDFHGSHVIIHNEKPSNEQLLVASEIALLMSNKMAGEVYYTEIRNVKKGSSLGEANLLSYKTINLNNVRESTKKLLNK